MALTVAMAIFAMLSAQNCQGNAPDWCALWPCIADAVHCNPGTSVQPSWLAEDVKFSLPPLSLCCMCYNACVLTVDLPVQ